MADQYIRDEEEVEMYYGVETPIICCDCSLTHNFKFQHVDKKRLVMTVVRDERVTAARRRHGNSGLQLQENNKWTMVRKEDTPSRKRRKK